MIRTAALSLALSLLATSALAQDPIDPARLSSITKVLASDEFEGRSPGTPGEAKTIEYLVREFKALGLEPAGDAGAYTQEVPLLHTGLKEGTASFALDLKGQRRVLTRNTDVTATTLRPVWSSGTSWV